ICAAPPSGTCGSGRRSPRSRRRPGSAPSRAEPMAARRGSAGRVGGTTCPARRGRGGPPQSTTAPPTRPATHPPPRTARGAHSARARDLPREIARWAGTTEAGFPVIVSALLDDAGVLAAIRLVTDARPDRRNDVADTELRKRADAHLFGQVMALRFGLEPSRD